MGDALMRLIYGLILSSGTPWQTLFYIGAALLFGLLVYEFFVLKPNPTSVGHKVRKNIECDMMMHKLT